MITKSLKYDLSFLVCMEHAEFQWVRSPNFNARPSDSITMIVVHHTVIPSLEETVNHFLNLESKVSSHYVLGRDGRIVQMVRDEDRAWHAGVSRWKGMDSCNDYSIGIEVVNRGDGAEPFTEEQYSSLRGLIGSLASKYGIAKDMVVGHRDIALPPGRKVDPADNFDWSVLAEFADRRRVAELAESMRCEYKHTHSKNGEQ